MQGTQVQDGPHPHAPSPQEHAPGAQAHPAQQLFFSFFCSIIVSPLERMARSSINADAPGRKILQQAPGIGQERIHVRFLRESAQLEIPLYQLLGREKKAVSKTPRLLSRCRLTVLVFFI